MRLLAGATTIAACLFAAHLATASGLVSASDISVRAPAVEKQSVPRKPGGAGAPQRGNDTCRWARDNECDDPDIGTGACTMGTDYSDCRHLREGENDSCRFARDGECDEPNFGTGACTQGTDRTDCGEISWMRNQNDSCATAFNNVCEDGPGGRCAPRTDRSDCRGRTRPTSINDHFFGRDDRILVNTNETPWRFVGRLHMDGGATCTATLIAPNVVVTAAHCLHPSGSLNAAGSFEASGGQNARITAYLIDQQFNYQRFAGSDDIDGLDWALLRLDQPLGDTLGYAGVHNLTGQGGRTALATDLMQAGYSWDTGDHLSGNLRCRMATVYPDNTFAHECDTTRGDSGSSFLVRSGQGFNVIGVDSSFRSNPNGPFLYIAVSAAGFASRVPDFVAGRTGTRVGGLGVGGKPGVGAGNPTPVRPRR